MSVLIDSWNHYISLRIKLAKTEEERKRLENLYEEDEDGQPCHTIPGTSQ